MPWQWQSAQAACSVHAAMNIQMEIQEVQGWKVRIFYK